MNEFFALLVLLFLSGLFSGSETALVALSMGRVESLLKEGRKGAKALYDLKRDPSQMLITILIGNNLVNIAASAIATVLSTEWFGSIGPGIAVGALTIFILIFGEITPKSLATRYAERISLMIAPLMYGLMRVMFPLVWLFGKFTTWIHQKTAVKGDPTVTEAELISLVTYGEAEGTIDRDERQMIERVFLFDDLIARDVMTPRSQVFALNAHLTVAEALPKVKRWHYSRIPIYEERSDDFHKVVHLRYILEACAEGKNDLPLHQLAHEPLFVPQNRPIDELFADLRSRKRSLAVVVDEFGVAHGIVTLEDVLEELVGEMYDESDKPQGIKELEQNKIAVDGAVEQRLVEEYFSVKLSGKPTDSVSLWVLSHAQRIPQIDDQFSIDGLTVTVAKATRNRIRQLVIAYTPPEPVSGAKDE